MKKSFRNVLKRLVKVLIICACITGIILTSAILITRKSEEKKELEAIEKIRIEKSNFEQNEEKQEIPKNKEEIEKEKQLLPQYANLHEKNTDLYGWISIEGSDTSLEKGYPVMFTPNDGNFYERRNFEKEESKSGSIWVDGRTKEDTENIIVYGHNMKNHTMFGSLKKYYNDKEYYEEHKYIQFDTLFERQTFEIISVLKARVYYPEKGEKVPEGEYLFYDHMELDNEKAFNDYIKYVKGNECYETGVTAKYGEQLITLCTCHGTNNERLLIVAKKI